eukprot:1151475-Pelagomonas_calceolata.AAC.2
MLAKAFAFHAPLASRFARAACFCWPSFQRLNAMALTFHSTYLLPGLQGPPASAALAAPF